METTTENPVGEVTGSSPEGNTQSQTPATASFVDSLPDDLRSDPTISRYKTAEDLARAHKELRSKTGWDPSEVVRLPKDGATDADYAPIYKALGRPDDGTGYEVPSVEGFKFNDGFVESMKQAAFETGLGKKQFENLMKRTGEYHKTQMLLQQNNASDQEKAVEEELKRSWGESYEENQKFVKLAQDHFGKDQKKYLTHLMNTLVDFGKTLQEDSAITAGFAEGTDIPTNAASARKELDMLKKAPDFMEKRRKDPEFNQRVTRLYQFAHPEEKKNG